MKNKKLFAILTLVCFLFTLMPVAAMAEGEEAVVEVSTAESFIAATTQSGITIKLTGSFDLNQNVTIPAGNIVTLDLNGKTISGKDNNQSGNFELISVGAGAHLIIKDETNTGSISLSATTNREWNALSAVIVNQQSTLTINGGTIEHLGGTDMAYAIDVETNQDGDSGDANLYINGGTIKSTAYHAIRAFANAWENSTDKCVINMVDGTIEGNRGILLQIASYDSAAQLIIEKGNINVSERAIRVWDSTSASRLNNTSVDIYGGNFAGGFMRSIQDSVNLDFEVTGGTFAFNPEDYLAEGSCIQTVSATEYVVDTHEVELVEATAPTCTEDGVLAHWACENCGVYSDENCTIPLESTVDPKKGHSMTAIKAKDATCTEAGNSAYWTCGVCGKYFSDEAGTTEIAKNSWVIAASHNDTAGWTTDDKQHWKVCAADGCDVIVVAKTDHTFGDWTTTKEATTSEKGAKERECSVCKYKETAEIDKLTPSYSGGGGSYVPSTSDKTESSTTTTVTPSGDTVKVETETKTESDGTKVETETTTTTTTTGETTKVETTTETKTDGTTVETTTTTTATGETTKVEVTTETNAEGTKVETTVTTDTKGETSTTVTATLDNGSAVTNNDAAVEVEVTKVEEKVVTQVEEAVKADDNIEVVGTADNAVSVSATDSNTGAAQTNFVQPMAVSVPVDTTVLNNVEDTSKLTLAKVVTNEDGTTALIYVGGSYDKETGKFNAKVNEDGDYILVEKADLVKIELTIDDTTVKHNDAHHELDVAPVINAETGRTELPLSYLGDALGFEVLWDGETRTVTVVKGDISFSLTIGEEIPGYGTPYIDVNSDRTMVSASYISGMLGANVIWDPVDRQVIVVK